MSAQIIDGKAVAERVRQEVQEALAGLQQKGVQPGLAVVIVGEDPASQVYVRNKVTACQQLGFYSEHHVLPADTLEVELLSLIDRLNQKPAVHGILVQLPLPKQMDATKIIARIDPLKDVDGFHAQNAGALFLGNPYLVPCTPAGVMRMLDFAQVPLSGRHAVVLGRSNIVGKPMAMLLLQAGATVTICHSQTVDLPAFTRSADILIAAVGKPNFVTADMVKPGAAVIDVGINRLPADLGGKLCGDVDFIGVREVAGWISPVPGGVGPMTITMLLANTLKAAVRQIGV